MPHISVRTLLGFLTLRIPSLFFPKLSLKSARAHKRLHAWHGVRYRVAKRGVRILWRGSQRQCQGASAADLLCRRAVAKTAPGGGLKLFRFNRTILCPASATNDSIDWTRPILSFRVRRSTQPGQPQMDATRLHYNPRYHLLPIIPALQASGEAKGEQQVDSGNTCDSYVSTCPPLFALCHPLRCEGPDGRGRDVGR